MKKSAIVIVLIGLLLIVAAFFAFFRARPEPETKKIMVLTASDLQIPAAEGVKAGLAELDWRQGVDYTWELFNPKGDRQLTKEMAAEIVAAKPDLIVSISTTASVSVKEANQEAKLPVVFVDVGNLEQLGIDNLQKPGGFMSGVATDNVPLTSKRMEFLKELLPDLTEVAVLLNSKHVSYQTIKQVNDEAAGALGISPIYYDVTKEEDLAKVLEQIVQDKPRAFMTTTEAIISGNAETIAATLRQAKIPSMDFNMERGVESGYLMVYGTTRFDIGKQASLFIDKVLRGQDPGQIPVEFAGLLTLELNAGVARDIGISFPETILLRASRIIEE